MTHWSGWSWRFRPDEFKVLSTEGPVAGASLADWPVDLRRDRALLRARRVGLRRRRRRRLPIPSAAPRKKGFPMPVHPARRATRASRRGAEARLSPVPRARGHQLPALRRPAGLHARRAPVATTAARSTPRRRRSRCDPEGARHGATRPPPQRAGLEITVGKDGRARSARYLDANGAGARGLRAPRGRRRQPSAPRTCCSFDLGSAPARPRQRFSGLVGRNLQFHHMRPPSGSSRSRTGAASPARDPRGDRRAAPERPEARASSAAGSSPTSTRSRTSRSPSPSSASPSYQARQRRWGTDLKDYHAGSRGRGRGRDPRGPADGVEPRRSRSDGEGSLRPPGPAHHACQHPNDLAMNRWYSRRCSTSPTRPARVEKWGARDSPRRRALGDEGQRPLPRHLPHGRRPAESVVDAGAAATRSRTSGSSTAASSRPRPATTRRSPSSPTPTASPTASCARRSAATRDGGRDVGTSLAAGFLHPERALRQRPLGAAQHAAPARGAAAAASTRHEVLTDAEWKTAEAITGRIIPTDHEPGARSRRLRQLHRQGPGARGAAKPSPLRARARRHRHGRRPQPSEARSSSSPPAQQDEVLAPLEAGTREGWPAGRARPPAPSSSRRCAPTR